MAWLTRPAASDPAYLPTQRANRHTRTMSSIGCGGDANTFNRGRESLPPPHLLCPHTHPPPTSTAPVPTALLTPGLCRPWVNHEGRVVCMFCLFPFPENPNTPQ